MPPLPRYGARSVLITPISDGGDDRGLLAVYSSRARYFESTSAGLFQKVAHLLHAVLASSRQLADRLPDEASDLVTGLANRRHAKRALEEHWAWPANTHARRAGDGRTSTVSWRQRAVLGGWSATLRCATLRRRCLATCVATTWWRAGGGDSSCCGYRVWPRAMPVRSLASSVPPFLLWQSRRIRRRGAPAWPPLRLASARGRAAGIGAGPR